MRRLIRNNLRILQILYILARQDALFLLGSFSIWPLSCIVLLGRRRGNMRPGQRLASAFEKLGPTFIKLGQALSTRSDLITEEVAADLAALRDRLPPFPTAIARRIVEEELGMPVESAFASFSETPVAAASVAQVHKAVTKEGNAVAVKILRPGIEEAFARDLEVFGWLADLAERRIAGSRRLKPRQVVQAFREWVFFELDLRFEAAAADELGRNMLKHDVGLRVPKVDWNRTSRRLLVTEWVEGIPIHDVERIRAGGIDPDDVLAKAARSLFMQVFEDGFFHADLHPGNLFVDAKGDLVAVDFGIMGRIDMKSRIYIAEILRGFLTGDYRHVAEVHFAAGYVPASKSIEAFTQACHAVAGPIAGKPLNEISVAKLLGQMFQIAAEFEMEAQPQLLLLQKTMMVTEGVGLMLNPQLNTWQLAGPLIEEWAQRHFGPLGKAREAALHALEAGRRLPDMMRLMEQSLHNIGHADGVRLHPDSLASMKQNSNTTSYFALLLTNLVLTGLLLVWIVLK